MVHRMIRYDGIIKLRLRCGLDPDPRRLLTRITWWCHSLVLRGYRQGEGSSVLRGCSAIGLVVLTHLS